LDILIFVIPTFEQENQLHKKSTGQIHKHHIYPLYRFQKHSSVRNHFTSITL